jgi:hypothetical protein
MITSGIGIVIEIKERKTSLRPPPPPPPSSPPPPPPPPQT